MHIWAIVVRAYFQSPSLYSQIDYRNIFILESGDTLNVCNDVSDPALISQGIACIIIKALPDF